ncbi:hypothetical protein JHL18_17885 [Clostridium sp. YIM B02505]|uniref:Uncharacterized protein n=1 Tax=Clostridium yunnanense TaxID=2800325 RepID=A0ABS1ET74_9CLOT|nr:hypothetical protein [Clostridium yunnanense]MBK1812493.1 hypothetical protein [Clostridium yunnanense]
MIETLKKYNKHIIISAGAILIIAISVYFLFNNFLYPERKQLADISATIVSINENLKKPIVSSSMDTELAISTLTDNLSKLLKEKNKLEQIKPSAKYKDTYENLSLGLNNNMKLYEQTLNIMKNPSSKDIQASLQNLTKYEEDCIKYYKLCKSNGVKVSLSPSFSSFFSSVSSYVNQLVKLNRDSDIKTSQKNDFLIAFDDCIKNFYPLKEDLSAAVTRAQDENRSLSGIQSDVANKIVQLEKLKTSLYEISVPSDGVECFSDFEETLKSYDTYISTLSEALKSQSNQAEKLKDAFSKYDDMNSSYKNFNKSYDDYKSKN